MGLWRNRFGKKPDAGAPNGGTGEKQPPSELRPGKGPSVQPGVAAREAEQRKAESVTMDAEEFDRLARDCYVKLEEWYVRSVMTVTGGSPDEMIGKLRKHIDSLARQAPQIGEATLDNIRMLDARLRLGGHVFSHCREASHQLARFRDTVNGADWQQAVKKSHDAAEALDAARKKLVGSGFGGVSVTINP